MEPPPWIVVNASGSDNIDVRTGQGLFGGTLTVVVQGDNAVDGPELVIMLGSFQGKMDFAPALLNGVPYGSVVGTLKVSKSKGAIPFTGVFRLPFAGNYAGPETGGATLRQLFWAVKDSNLGPADQDQVAEAQRANDGECRADGVSGRG